MRMTLFRRCRSALQPLQPNDPLTHKVIWVRPSDMTRFDPRNDQNILIVAIYTVNASIQVVECYLARLILSPQI